MLGFSRRKKSIRELRKRIVIVCEGKKTEPIYFKGFKRRFSNVEIVPLHGACTDPKNIVEFAKKQKKEYELDLSNGEGLWCVFDVDSNEERDIRDSVAHANKHKIKIALSNPCFEIWYLLHFIYTNTGLTRKDTIKRLKKHIPSYEKHENINKILEDKLERAIEHTKRLNKCHENDGICLLSTKSNPSSQVFELVEFIRETIERNKELSSIRYI